MDLFILNAVIEIQMEMKKCDKTGRTAYLKNYDHAHGSCL